jgi:hypothetical protein
MNLEAEWLATFARLDSHTAEMERRIAAGEVSDPIIITMVRRTRAAIEEFYAASMSTENRRKPPIT